MNELKKWLEEIDSNFARLNELNNESNNLTTNSMDIWKGYKSLMSKIEEMQTSESPKNNSSKQEVPPHSEYPDIEAGGIVFCGKCGQQKLV